MTHVQHAEFRIDERGDCLPLVYSGGAHVIKRLEKEIILLYLQIDKNIGPNKQQAANNMQKHSTSSESNCPNCVLLKQEIGALKADLAELKQHAFGDVLTGLWNRRYFIKSLKDRIARCQRYGDNTAVLFLDVDNLKMVNDEYGHAAGDALLVRLAEILKQHTRTSDVVARIGGDEFGILLDNLDGDRVVEKIGFLDKQFGSANCTYKDTHLPLAAAIGYCFVGPKDTVEALMSRADAAMYRDKEKPA